MSQYEVIVEELFKHKFKGGPSIDFIKNWKTPPEKIEKVEKYLKNDFEACISLYKQLTDNHHAIGEFQYLLDKVVREAGILADLYGYAGDTSICDEMEIPMWQGTFNYVKLNMPWNFTKMITFEELKKEVVEILDLVNSSQAEIISAIKKGHPDDFLEEAYEPETIGSITFDYFEDKPEYVISVASNKEYSYKVLINKDRTFISDSIG